MPLAIYGGYNLVASLLISDYWAVWTLEPVRESPAQPGKLEG